MLVHQAWSNLLRVVHWYIPACTRKKSSWENIPSSTWKRASYSHPLPVRFLRWHPCRSMRQAVMVWHTSKVIGSPAANTTAARETSCQWAPFLPRFPCRAGAANVLAFTYGCQGSERVRCRLSFTIEIYQDNPKFVFFLVYIIYISAFAFSDVSIFGRIIHF